MKGLIDAGADENAILTHYKDPHLYTAMIKYEYHITERGKGHDKVASLKIR